MKLGTTTLAVGALAAAASVLVSLPSTTAIATEDMPAWCTTSGELRSADLPETVPVYEGCDLTGRIIRNGSVFLEIQPPGMGVGIEGAGIGSAHPHLSLSTMPDGTVQIDDGRDESSEASAVPPGVPNPLDPDPCAAVTASSYMLSGFKAYVTEHWRYNGANAPSNVAGAASDAFSQAGSRMADGVNSCGITKIPRDSYQARDGATTTASHAFANTCGAYDTTNVVAWRNMGTTGGTLAVTCSWWYTDMTPWRWAASDMAYNTAYSWTTDVLTCVGVYDIGSYDLVSIATHEWGHAFGLGHVAEAGTTSSQTMSTNSDGTCQDNESTLGRGDLNGMIKLYGSIG